MGLVYIYQSSLYCEECGEKIVEEHPKRAKYRRLSEDEYDSDEFPKGPVEEGESDTPSHCEGCGVFLESELTEEGMAYVKEQVRLWLSTKHYRGNREVIAEWKEYYDIPNPNFSEEILDKERREREWAALSPWEAYALEVSSADEL